MCHRGWGACRERLLEEAWWGAVAFGAKRGVRPVQRPRGKVVKCTGSSPHSMDLGHHPPLEPQFSHL